ncbi:MAG: hypothetical protein KAI18_04565 [Candidatus Aenigmarchaeota archaeon]|nr:hypothetical protein [Candidatus Aenigmarchaeota archaeon]
MSLEMKYHLSKDDIVIKNEKEGSYHFLFPILPEFLPSEVALYEALDRTVYISDNDFFVGLNLDDNLEFFDNGFLKNLYVGDDCGVEFSSYNLNSCLYTERNFNMDYEKFNLFFRDTKEIMGVIIGKGSVFETKNVSDYKTACLLRDYLCQLHNKAVDLIFESYLSQDVL